MNTIYLLIGLEILVVLVVSGFLFRKIFKFYSQRKKGKDNSD